MLSLEMDTSARQVCLNVDVEEIARSMLECCQPDALGHIHHQVTTRLQYKRTGQTMEPYLLEFDILRRRVQVRVIMGGAFSNGFKAILRMQNAALSRNEEELLSARVRVPLAFSSVPKQMRRLLGPSRCPSCGRCGCEFRYGRFGLRGLGGLPWS